MKKVIGKNQVIITSLAILIAVAGYLNFADVDLGFRDKEASTDSSSILEDAGYDLTDETALLDENQADGGLTDNNLTDSQETDTPGEAVFTGSTGFAAQAKISREQVRSQNKADLQDIINNEEIDDEEKQEAIHTMVSMTDLSEKEAAAELLLEAKGFKNVVVNLTGETADVVIPEAELSDAQRAQIEDIVKRKTGIAPENIVIFFTRPPQSTIRFSSSAACSCPWRTLNSLVHAISLSCCNTYPLVVDRIPGVDARITAISCTITCLLTPNCDAIALAATGFSSC